MRHLLTAAVAIALPACGVSAEPVPSDEAGGTMFVANKRGASLSRIDLATGEETHRAETCENPHELTVSPNREAVVVACYSGRELQVFGTEDLSPLGEIVLGEGARVHSAIWDIESRLLAGAEGRGSLYVVVNPLDEAILPSLDTYLEIGGGGPGPHLVAVQPGGRHAWGTIIPNGEVVRYHLPSQSEAARSQIGPQIEAIALSPDGSSLWVSSNALNVAYRLDPETLEVQAEVPTGMVPIRLAMHPSGDWVVSSNYLGGDLTVIDTATNTVARTITVSGTEEAAQVTLVFSEDGSRLYAAETARDTIAEIDFASGEVLRRIATGPGGDGLAVMD